MSHKEGRKAGVSSKEGLTGELGERWKSMQEVRESFDRFQGALKQISGSLPRRRLGVCCPQRLKKVEFTKSIIWGHMVMPRR